MASLRASLVIPVLFAFSCGGGSKGAGPDADGNQPECTSSDGCDAPLVCEPVTQSCQTPSGTCADQSECSGGTYCEGASGVCLPSAVGTPCATADNCDGSCIVGVCGCDGVVNERQLAGGPLDIYLMLDRSGSMVQNGNDCAYDPVTNPTAPESSKGCYATYALANYVTSVAASSDTRLALGFMSNYNKATEGDSGTNNEDDCDGSGHDDPTITMTTLPVARDSSMVQAISDEDFSGGYGTLIEGALRGIASYTAANVAVDREMIGVLITDGEPNGCEENTDNLADIIAQHYADTGLRTFIIGMDGANHAALDVLAKAGGAEAHNDYCGDLAPGPCYFFDVGDGSGTVLEEALLAIAQQAVEIPCDVDITNLQAPEGELLDYNEVNVTFSEGASTVTMGRVDGVGSCPSDQPAWYYDNPGAPTTIHLCESACASVSAAGDGANLAVVAGCAQTVVIVE